MSKIRADSIVDTNDAAAVELTYGASIPVGQTFNIQGNLNHTGISTVGILTITNANVSGIVTATTFKGNGAGLTNIPAASIGKIFALQTILDPMPFRS